jgi:hypothetical protein
LLQNPKVRFTGDFVTKFLVGNNFLSADGTSVGLTTEKILITYTEKTG